MISTYYSYVVYTTQGMHYMMDKNFLRWGIIFFEGVFIFGVSKGVVFVENYISIGDLKDSLLSTTMDLSRFDYMILETSSMVDSTRTRVIKGERR